MQAVGRFTSEQPDTDVLICECIPCRFCQGEGTREWSWTKDNQGRDVELPYSVTIECDECHGSGRDQDDCAIHGRIL